MKGPKPKSSRKAPTGVRMMTVHSAKGLEFPVVILADLTCKETGAAQRFIDPERRLCAMSIAGCLPDELLERREDEERRDHEESVRLLYVAATRARDLLVVPVVGDRSAEQEQQEDGMAAQAGAGGLSAAGRVRSPQSRNPPGCPGLWRGECRAASLQCAAGGQDRLRRDCISRSPGRIAWSGGIPTKLQLDEEEAMGLRQVKLLQADEGGAASQAGQQAYQRWTGRRKAVREAAGAPLIKVATATELAAAVESVGRAAVPAIAEPSRGGGRNWAGNRTDCAASPGGRPHGARFGTLVHGVLLQARLDAAAGGNRAHRGVARPDSGRERRGDGRRGGSGGAGAGLRRDEAGARRGRALPARMSGAGANWMTAPWPKVWPTSPSKSRLVGARCWTVVDFKTDVEIGGHLAQYRAQLEIYMRGIRTQHRRGGARRPAVGVTFP